MTRQRILVHHIGSLGDTLVAVPALRMLRENYPLARITMLTDRQPGRNLVMANDILDGSGLIDDYITYIPGNRTAILKLLLRLRFARFDCLAYLIRTHSNEERVARDRRFFRLAGIKQVLGMDGLPSVPDVQSNSPLPHLPHITDTLLSRLAASGLDAPAPGQGDMNIGIGDREQAKVTRWLSGLPSFEGRRWIGVGIGSKMPAKLWPLDRYETLVTRICETFDVWPVVFGGPEDRTNGQMLVERWGRGYVACGDLNIRESVAALARCRLFVGNDTGTTHMAAAAGVRCVGIYSARDFPGLWSPYGRGHVVFRTATPCEGCMLEECVAQRNHCMTSIAVEPVLEACCDMLYEANTGTPVRSRSKIFYGATNAVAVL